MLFWYILSKSVSESSVDFSIALNKLSDELGLNIIGTMCIPPANEDPIKFFLEMNKINQDLNLLDLSMGMSEDYLEATKKNATFLRIGSKIFGQRD